MTESQTRPCVLPPLRQGGYFGGRAQKPHHSDKLCAHTREVLFPSHINPGKTRRNLCIRSKTFLKIKSLFNIFFVLIPFSYCWCLKEPLKLMGLIYCARARVCVSKTHQERDRSPVVLLFRGKGDLYFERWQPTCVTHMMHVNMFSFSRPVILRSLL